jgi:hypothetical protein
LFTEGVSNLLRQVRGKGKREKGKKGREKGKKLHRIGPG